MGDFTELAPLYGVPGDAVTVVLLGGPLDGEEHHIPTGGRSDHDLMLMLLSYWFPLPPPESFFVPPEEVLRWPPPLRQAGYRLMRDAFGQPSRDDTGRLRMEFRGLM